MKTEYKVYILNPRDGQSRMVLESLLNKGWQVDIANEEHVSVAIGDLRENAIEHGNIVYVLYKEDKNG